MRNLGCLLLLISILFIPNKASARQDDFGSPREEVGRSSVTTTADLNVVIASGSPIVLRGISVDMPGTSSKLELFDSAITTVIANGAKRVTAPIDTTARYNPKYGILCSSGLAYSNSGTTPAQVTILWDWLLGVPTGQLKIGRTNGSQ